MYRLFGAPWKAISERYISSDGEVHIRTESFPSACPIAASGVTMVTETSGMKFPDWSR